MNDNIKMLAGSIVVAYVLLLFPTFLTLYLFDIRLSVSELEWVAIIPSIPVGYLIKKLIYK